MTSEQRLNISFSLIAALSACLPAMVVTGSGPISESTICLVASAAVLCAALFCSTLETKVALEKLRFLKLAIAIPLIGICCQLLPMPNGLAHSIWPLTGEALGQDFWGHITIDTGLTLLSLVHYLALISIAISTLIVASERRSAELLWTVLLLSINFCICVSLPLHFLGIGDGLVSSDNLASGATQLSTIGLPLSFAAMSRKLAVHPINGKHKPSEFLIGFPLIGFSLAVCSIGVLTNQEQALFPVIIGLLLFGVLGVARWIPQTTPWLSSLPLLTALAAASMITVGAYSNSLSTWLIPEDGSGTSFVATTTHRMVSDAGALGLGAGTYKALLPIYQADPIVAPPSTIAVLAVELGLPAATIVVLLLLMSIILLLRRALARRRDWFYPAASAACLACQTYEAFYSANPSGLASASIVAIVAGIGLAQSAGRSTQFGISKHSMN